MPGFEQMVGVLKAAGEPTRLRLLSLLAAGELSVKDLTDILGQSQPRVSRHLKLLADAGLVQRHAEGAWAYYRLAESGPSAELARQLVSDISLDDPSAVADRTALEQVRWTHQEQAAAYFASVADSWDLLRSLHVPEAAVEKAILEAVGKHKIGLMLDLGTGTGRMLELLADRYQRGLGVDSSREMLGVARAKLTGAGINHAQIRLGDISDLDETNGPADLIVLHQVLHYFDDPGQIITRARRALADDGQLLIADFASHQLEFLRTDHAHRRLGLDDEQVASWARAAGLDISTSRQFPSDNGAEGLTVCLWLLQPGEQE